MIQKEIIGLIRESIGKVLISEQSEYQWAEERRQRDDWERENLHSGDLGSAAHALYYFLKSEGEIGEDKDVYDIIPMGSEYDMYVFSTSDDLDKQWIVGTADDAFESAKGYLKDQIDSEGLATLFSSDFISNYVDKENFEHFLRNNFDEYVREEPESVLDERDRELTEKQTMFIQYLELKLQKLEKKLESTEDQDEIEKIQNTIENTQEKIEEAIEHYVEQYKDDIESYFQDWYGEFNLTVIMNNDLIDVDELVYDVVSTDGAAHIMNYYDGTSDEVRFEGDTYEIMVWNR